MKNIMSLRVVNKVNLDGFSKTKEYVYLHQWVRKNKGKPSECSKCYIVGFQRPGKYGGWSIQWANIDGRYRRNLDDFIALCVKCHRRHDGISEEQKIKMSLAHKGKPGNRALPILKVSLNGEIIARYSSAKEAYKETRILNTSIANVIAGKSKTAGGFQWRLV